MIRTLTSRIAKSAHAVHRFAALGVLAVLGSTPAFALVAPADASGFSAGSVAGNTVMDKAAGSLNSVSALLLGPGLYVIMAIGALLALFGFARGNKETLFSGIGLFVLAAIIKGVVAFV